MSIERWNHASGAPWEAIVGYSRAVRVGRHVHVSGTTASDGEGGVLHRGDPEGQTREILRRITDALAALGAAPHHVVRTRIYVTDIGRWEAVARAHGDLFTNVRPAATMVQVQRLIHEHMLVEIEVEAYVHDDDAPAREAGT